MSWMQRKWALTGVALGVGLALAACAAPAPTATPTRPPAAAPTPTTVGPTPTKAPTATPTKRPVTKVPIVLADFSSSMMPVWVARGKGYFQEEGVDPEWTTTGGGAKALAAVVGGSAPLGLIAAPDTASAVGQGQPVQVIGVVSIGVHGEIVMRKAAYQAKGLTEKSTLEERVKALKGLTLGASSPGSASDFRFRFLLTQFGLDPERDVQMTYVGTSALVAAIAQGSVDAISGNPPITSQPVVDGTGTLLISYTRGDVPGTKDTMHILTVAGKEAINNQGLVLEGFVRALWRAMRLMQQNKADAAQAAAKSTFADLDPRIFNDTFETSYNGFPTSPVMDEQRFKATVDYRNLTTPDQPPLVVDFKAFYNSKFVDAAKQQLGF